MGERLAGRGGLVAQSRDKQAVVERGRGGVVVGCQGSLHSGCSSLLRVKITSVDFCNSFYIKHLG